MDLIFLIDSSGSIRHERFPHIIDFLLNIVKELNIGRDATRVGALKFSDVATMEFPFDRLALMAVYVDLVLGFLLWFMEALQMIIII